MAHFAKLDENNIVLDVNVVDNENIQNLPFPESEPIGISFLTKWSGGHTNWKQTSYNANFRKHYAGIDYTFDIDKDAFIPPKPFESWVLNENTYLWDSPVPYPTDVGTPENPKRYKWDENTISWIKDDNI